jgi:hypothetical protein
MPVIPAADVKEIVADLAAVASDLAKATANHDHIVAAEAKKIGDRLGVGYAKTAREQIDEKDAELRRQLDLVAELRRQMKSLERHADRCFRLEKAIRSARTDGATINVEFLLGIINAPAKPDDKEN